MVMLVRLVQPENARTPIEVTLLGMVTLVRLVYESIASRNNCLGFVSDGVTTITILRNGRKRKVLYDRDTIVLDKYLQMPGNEAKRRFVLGHEAGHVITNRIYGNAAAYYNHV